MTIVESLQLERSKNPNEIILFKEGSWWRAYEESAFICRSINSYLGIISHYSSFRLRFEIFATNPKLYEIGCFDRKLTKFILNL